MTRAADSLKLAGLAFAGAMIGLAVWAAPDLKAWLGPLFAAPAPVQTSALAGGCRQPHESEQLHIILAWRDGLLVRTGCMYVGSRGTYSAGARK